MTYICKLDPSDTDANGCISNIALLFEVTEFGKRVSVIAYDSGSTCIPYFNRLFQKQCVMSPSIYRKISKRSEDNDAMEKTC